MSILLKFPTAFLTVTAVLFKNNGQFFISLQEARQKRCESDLPRVAAHVLKLFWTGGQKMGLSSFLMPYKILFFGCRPRNSLFARFLAFSLAARAHTRSWRNSMRYFHMCFFNTSIITMETVCDFFIMSLPRGCRSWWNTFPLESLQWYRRRPLQPTIRPRTLSNSFENCWLFRFTETNDI